MKRYWYWLTTLDGVGRKRAQKLLDMCGSPKELFNTTSDEFKQLLGLIGISQEKIQAIINSRKKFNLDSIVNKCTEKNIDMISIDDERYPSRLKNIYDPPYIIYVKGKLPDFSRPSIAIVGARGCSRYGADITKIMAKELSSYGIQIISGMAMGIDKYAHEGALSTGQTFGILGCGPDVCYPQINIDIYMDIIGKGGIISEYPPGTKPLKHHFPERNRIISGLSDGVLVTEARKESGSLITANMGLEQGKNIYAIPGRITDEYSVGCNELIKAGAKCVISPQDIIEDYNNLISKREYNMESSESTSDVFTENLLETHEKIVYACLRLSSKHIEEICDETGLEAVTVMNTLVGLQIKGLIKQTAMDSYSKAGSI